MATSAELASASPNRQPAGSYGGDDAKERVREAVDIVDLIGSYISLRRNGRNLVGLCPWHDDSRPSLQINPERQTFRCWVCNIGGDAFSFLMRMERLEFREALEQLAERVGIDLPKAEAPAATSSDHSTKRSLGPRPASANACRCHHWQKRHGAIFTTAG